VLSFFSSPRNRDTPTPSSVGECVLYTPPPPPVLGHTRWRERGWESPNSDEGSYTVVLLIYTYFVVPVFLYAKPTIIHIFVSLTVLCVHFATFHIIYFSLYSYDTDYPSFSVLCMVKGIFFVYVLNNLLKKAAFN
jgi:hypothetical protein